MLALAAVSPVAANHLVALQSFFDSQSIAINAHNDETGIETFTLGNYQGDLLAEFAGFASQNVLSFYPVGSSSSLTTIFSGPAGPGTMVTFTPTSNFGLALSTPQGYTYPSQASLTPDNVDHALVYRDPRHANGFIIGWEDLFGGGDFDYEDMIVAIRPLVRTVSIDIKPGSDPNSINPRSTGTIPVAILSDSTFDAPSEVDPSSLTFGHTGNEASLVFCTRSFEDFNSDGLLDLVCHFGTRATGFGGDSETGTLKGQLMDGTRIEGTDAVRIVRGGGGSGAAAL